jgi:hypothetical protein
MKTLVIWITVIHSYTISAAVGAFNTNFEEADYNNGGCANTAYSKSVTSNLNLEEFSNALTRSKQKNKFVPTKAESLQSYCGVLMSIENAYYISDGIYNAFYWGDPPEGFYRNIPGGVVGKCICIRASRRWVPSWPGSADGRWELINMVSAVTCKKNQKDRARNK